jgi:hypothetical protein
MKASEEVYPSLEAFCILNRGSSIRKEEWENEVF